jgi:hypothetical protein
MRSNMSTPPAPSKLSKPVLSCGIAFIVVVAAALIAVVVVAAYLVIRLVAETGYKVTGEMWSLGTSMVRNKEGAKWNEPGFRCVVAREGLP